MIAIADVAGTGLALQVRRLVVKLGSSVVLGEGSVPDGTVLAALARSLAALRQEGVQAMVVTSGALGLGRQTLGRPAPKTLPEKQALCAIGQISLMRFYQQTLGENGLQAAQVLLTRGDMEDRRRYLNARHTLERLLELGATPIINENDTTATEEISFGDNDMLSAYVAIKMRADLLILLSSVDGVYRPAPGGGGRSSAPRQRVPVIERVDETAFSWVNPEQSSHGTGGMRSKLIAARMASEAGVPTVIAHGKDPDVLDRIRAGNFTGTFIPAQGARTLAARERWIAFGRDSRGNRLRLDAGAVEALTRRNSSLLPVGVVAVEGSFEKGDIVDLCDPDGRTVARGLTNYPADDVRKIMGRQTSQIAARLGSCPYEEIVHRDNLVLLDPSRRGSAPPAGPRRAES